MFGSTILDVAIALTRDAFNSDRRSEMREIKEVITQFANTPLERRDVKATLEKIAGLIQHMKRLWGNDQRGLLIRRDAEAKLIRDTQIASRIILLGSLSLSYTRTREIAPRHSMIC